MVWKRAKDKRRIIFMDDKQCRKVFPDGIYYIFIKQLIYFKAQIINTKQSFPPHSFLLFLKSHLLQIQSKIPYIYLPGIKPGDARFCEDQFDFERKVTILTGCENKTLSLVFKTRLSGVRFEPYIQSKIKRSIRHKMQTDIFFNRYYFNTSAYGLYIAFTQARDQMEIVLIDFDTEEIYKEIVREGDAKMSKIEIIALQHSFKQITDLNKSHPASAYGITTRCELGQVEAIKKDLVRLCGSVQIGEERVNIQKIFQLEYSGKVENSGNSSAQIEELKKKLWEAEAKMEELEKENARKEEQIQYLLESLDKQKQETIKREEIINQVEKGDEKVNKDEGSQKMLPFNKNTQFINYFEFRGNKVIKKYDCVVQLLGSKPIPTLGSIKYCFQINKANPHMSLGFGVIDSAEIKTQFTHESSKNLIYYWAREGKVYGDGRGIIKKKGKTILQQGDVVEMSVSLQGGYVRWSMNMREESHHMDKLRDTSISWVPYIIMTFNGDEITWMSD